MARKEPPRDPEADTPEDIDRRICQYVDRLNLGETLDPVVVLAENPIDGLEILERLERFVGSLAVERTPDQPLGTLGDYTLRRQIGRGGMGVVYEAWQNSLDRRVALKVLPAGIAADNRAFLRFMKEAKTAAQLNHRNVVAVYGMGVEQNTPYFAMELVEGETLAQILARLKRAEGKGKEKDEEKKTILQGVSGLFGKGDTAAADAEVESEAPALSPKTLFESGDFDLEYYARLAKAFAGVAEGLQQAHSKGIIHRDIKPSNLILDREGRLRILDFGLARLEGQESITLSGDLVGTPLYMSPEQARRKKIAVDHRTDVYSLGATLYEMLTLKPPFQGKDHQDTLSRIIEREPVEPRKVNQRVPKDLETIVLKCLRKEATDRYGTAEALAQDLRRFARGVAIEARTQPTWEKLSRRAWRQRWKAALALLFLVLLLLVGGLALKRHEESLLRIRAEYDRIVLGAVTKMQRAALAQQAETGESFIFGARQTNEILREGGLDPLPEAVGDLEKAILLDPQRPDAHYHRARGLTMLGMHDDALGEIARVLRRSPTFVPSLLLEAGIHERRGDHEKARARKEDAERFSGGGWAQAWLAAQRLKKEGRWAEAAEAYNALIRLEARGEAFLGSSFITRLGRGQVLLGAKEYIRALKDFAVAEERWPDAVEPGLLEGKTLYLLGKKDEAERVFADAYEKAQPKDGVALAVAWIYFLLGDLEKDNEWTSRIQQDYLRDAVLVRALWHLGRRHEAEAAGRRAVLLNPRSSRAYIQLGIMLFHTGRMDESIAQYEKMLELEPRSAFAHQEIGSNLRKQGRTQEAIEWLERALDLDPRLTFARSLIGRCLVKEGKGQEALAVHAEALRIDPTNVDCHYQWAMSLAELGKIDDAIAAYDRCIELDPTCSWPYIWKGNALVLKGEVKRAIELYRQSAALVPKDVGSNLQLGKALESEGARGEAFVEYRKALEIEPQNVETHARLAALLSLKPAPYSADDISCLVETVEKAVAAGQTGPQLLRTLALAHVHHPAGSDTARGLEHLNEAFASIPVKSPEQLAVLAEIQALAGRLPEAVLTAEAASRLPNATTRVVDQLKMHREALLPRFASCASIDAALERTALEGEAVPDPRQLLEGFRAAADGPSGGLLAYLDGRVREAEGQHLEAVEMLREAARGLGKEPEPVLRLVQALRTAGESAAAEHELREACVRGLHDRQLWDLWAAVSMVDLGRAPSEMLADFPATPEEARPAYAADLLRLLEQLTQGGAVRINCGGDEYTSGSGVTWGRDRFFEDGHRFGEPSAEPFRCERDILGTDDDPLYQTERRFPRDLYRPARYRLPLPPGSYTVTLHFAELRFRVAGQRVFDVRIEGKPVLEGYDSFSAGFATAEKRSFRVEVTDGLLEIDLVGRVGEPKLSAIEVEGIR